ncbi:MarR family winged helix-turn-helix transcriptional regulator [Meiothermus granaticius]|uniref:Transcriptional regulator SlyA n=1 Tax=Meiothermus granaticius NBRC 107808 TaxID=1227551 RepID=A0A399F566_9DEIN|nr:MarR family transcriptional regulator [Meiothermus granaticius]MCL6525893.1 MarR family transcriptional regulator [Thermaceae bacterium]RIH91907.1 Transcriptional regulator SlyA [Meiothermus granaticius NBRC 107808]GEM85473.1 MarR family transcriptional regulator [Meiothermus granaticius NBRC 107808]
MKETESLYDELSAVALDLAHHLRRDAQKATENLGVTPMQAYGMMLLADGYTQPSGLAEAMGTSPPVLSQILAGLEERGWISRHPDPEDRRRVRLELTESGKAFHAQMQSQWRAASAPRYQKLSPPEVQTLIRLLRKMVQASGVRP